MRIIFFGTPHFAAKILDYLIDQSANIVAVVTKPDKPIKRSREPQPSPVKVLAREKLSSIPLFQPLKASHEEFAQQLKAFEADIFVVAAYSEIFKENLLKMPLGDCINVHASLLPKYRGAAPIQRAIMEGETETGVTIMSMVARLDAGGMLKQVKTPIPFEMTAGELTDKLAEIGGKALWEVILAYQNNAVHPLQQNDAEATYAAKLKDEDGLLIWSHDALSLHNQVRGVTPNPGAWIWVFHKGVKKRVRIGKALYQKKEHQALPGTILPSTQSELIIACGKDALLLKELQMEGKKMLPISDFLRGISKKELSFP